MNLIQPLVLTLYGRICYHNYEKNWLIGEKYFICIYGSQRDCLKAKILY